MSNNIGRQMSQRKQVRSALERIEALEQDVPRIVAAVNEAMMSQQQRQGQLANIVEALVEMAGGDTVDAKIKEIEARKMQAQADAAKAALEKGIAEGQVVPADVVGDKSLVVGREFGADGTLVAPGRVQLLFSAIKPEFQEKLLGQGVLTTIETPGGGKFEVTEIYNVVETAPAAETTLEAEAPAETPAALDAALQPVES